MPEARLMGLLPDDQKERKMPEARLMGLLPDGSGKSQPIQTDGNGALKVSGGGGGGGSDTVAQNSDTAGQSGVLTQGAVTTNAPAYTTSKTNPLSLTTTGRLRVEIASELRSGNATATNTASIITEAQLLAANANRKGATITNTDANPLYVDFVTGVSNTNYAYLVPANGGVVEIPYGYTGIVYGIWAVAGAGGARAREFT